MTQQLQTTIDTAWEDRANLSPAKAPKDVLEAVDHVISQLNNGTLRVATREAVGQWTVHQWIKKAVLLSFRLKDNAVMKAGDLGFYDKVRPSLATCRPQKWPLPACGWCPLPWRAAAASSPRVRS